MAYASIDDMRDFVAKLYGGNWSERVLDMPDNQIMAIYYSAQEQERSGKQPRRRNEKPRKNREKRQKYDPRDRFNDESDADYYDRINGEM